MKQKIPNIDSTEAALDFFRNINWNKMAKQVFAVDETAHDLMNTNMERYNELMGVYEMIENMRDLAVNTFGFDKDYIFRFEQEHLYDEPEWSPTYTEVLAHAIDMPDKYGIVDPENLSHEEFLRIKNIELELHRQYLLNSR